MTIPAAPTHRHHFYFERSETEHSRSRPGSRPSGRRVRDEVASGGRSDAAESGWIMKRAVAGNARTS
ncbi:hypothetical protein, partial [Nocardia amamiensis]|uniref:hypothetical protein n=1 Tax=Nocardia amamiensis TaxID=404578 RepID=UPI003401E48B